MSIIRCFYCQLPMTETEAVHGNCPSCGGAIDAEGNPREESPAEQARDQAAANKKAGSFWLVSGLAGLILLAAGVWYFFLGPEVWNPEEEPNPPNANTVVAQGKGKPTSQTQKEKSNSSPVAPSQKTEVKKTEKTDPPISQTNDPNKPEPAEPQDAGEGIQQLNSPDGEVTFKSLNNGAQLKLTGQVGKLIFHEVNGKSKLDASKLQAKEIIFTGGINGGSTVFLNAPKGKVIFQGGINGESEVQVRAPDGVVIFGNPEAAPGGDSINGKAQIAILAREVDIRGAVNGTHTLITIGLNPGGKLKFHALQGAAQLLYKSLDPTGVAPIIEAGKMSPAAKLEKVD